MLATIGLGALVLATALAVAIDTRLTSPIVERARQEAAA
jgi:hypothetical protein